MAFKHWLSPQATSLSAFTRNVAYSLETTIVDLTGDSSSTEGSPIEIFCDLAKPRPALAIIGNGKSGDYLL